MALIWMIKQINHLYPLNMLFENLSIYAFLLAELILSRLLMSVKLILTISGSSFLLPYSSFLRTLSTLYRCRGDTTVDWKCWFRGNLELNIDEAPLTVMLSLSKDLSDWSMVSIPLLPRLCTAALCVELFVSKIDI